MTPKEKAKELFDKMIYQIEWNAQPSTVKGVAKQCALIAVDETLNMFIETHNKFIELSMLKGNVKETATYIYWQDVKHEIEKL